ncbi:MAG TPA: FtsQ-type POTRA domain-containing protein [Rhodospirillaceae bacterium]|nr:FtsQ-type POTRA domain-containing protein [Rhodospirillaceae bacterium]
MRRLGPITIAVEDRPGSARTTKSAAKKPVIARRRFGLALLRRNARTAIAVLAILGLTGSGFWLTRSAAGQHLQDQLRQDTITLSGRAGFSVEEIFVEGRNRTPRDAMLAALGIHRGDPMFGIDLAAARRQIEEISWVKTATIERRLPNEIHVLITERAPVALWQNQGRYFLIDRDGQVVGDEIEAYAGLPLTVGEGAPDHAAQLIDVLGAEPGLQSRVKAAQWVGGRRWNVTLESPGGGIEVQLPEEDPLASWHELARLEKEQSLLERQITLVDMRLPDRLVLRTSGAAQTLLPAGPPRKKPQPGKDA